MIPDVSAHSALRLDRARTRTRSRSGRWRSALLIGFLLVSPTAIAHEAERTRVTLALEADGSFTLEVANDPMWLLLRLETFAGGSVPPNMSAADRDARL